MPRIQRVAHYIQQLAYESLMQNDKREEQPQDALAHPEHIPSYPSWNAASFSVYTPFRGPRNG